MIGEMLLVESVLLLETPLVSVVDCEFSLQMLVAELEPELAP